MSFVGHGVLYQKSVDTMNCPNEWLKALIIAIFKKGVKCLAENYRPISLTSILCKSMESPITEHIKNHMATNRFFSTSTTTNSTRNMARIYWKWIRYRLYLRWFYEVIRYSSPQTTNCEDEMLRNSWPNPRMGEKFSIESDPIRECKRKMLRTKSSYTRYTSRLSSRAYTFCYIHKRSPGCS